VGTEHGDIDREGGHPRVELNIVRQGDEGYGGAEQNN
jgi:hypothetical protein